MILKRLLIPLILFGMISGCGEKEEPELECPSGAKLLLSDNNEQCGVVSRNGHSIKNGKETYYLYLDYFPYGNADFSLTPEGLIEEGVTYLRIEGAGYSANHLGGINSFDITVEKLDRENQLMTLSFNLDGTVLSNNTSFVMSGTLTDLPLTDKVE